MNKLIKMVRKVAASSRLLAAGLIVLSLTAQAADELTQLLVWQGQTCTSGKITLTKSINVSTDELIVEKDLVIDLNGFDLCVKSVGGVLKTYRGNVAIINSKTVSGSAKAYFPYHIDAYTDAEGVTHSGSITVNEGVVFGPTCFGIIDNTSLVGWVESGKGLRFLAGAFFSDDFFIASRHCAGAFIFERGACVCKAVRDAMLKGIGKTWAALRAKVSDILTNGFYIMLEDGEAKIEVTKAFSAWPWRDRLYVGYRVSGIMDHGVDYKVTLYCGAGDKMPLKELYSYKSDNGFEHLITSGHHEVQFDTDGVLGTGWGSFFPKNLNTTDTEVKAVLSMKENDAWVVVSESSLKGFLIDNRANKVVMLGGTYPIAYSGVGFFGLPGILTGVTYTTPEWKKADLWPHLPYLDPELVVFHEAHIDVGTKDWTPDRCVTYHWQHQNGLEIYAATIRVTDKIAHVPTGRTLVYNGMTQQGVANGVGYKLCGAVTAKCPGTYTVVAKLNSDYIWDDGLGDDKTITWKIVGATIEDKTATVPSCTYTGSALKPIPSIPGLTYGKDFEVVGYENNVNAGIATVIIRGKGNYSGEIQANFTIDPKAITKLPATQEFTYDGQTHRPLAADGAWTLGGTTSATDVGTYTMTVTPSANCVWADAAPGQERATRTVEWKIVPVDISAFIDESTFLSPRTFVYDGTAKTPTVTIATLKAGVDYDIAFEDNVNAGTAKVKITGKGNMAGSSYEGTFTIMPGSIKNTAITISPSSMPVGGKPAVTVKYGGRTLVEGTDYTVAYTGYSKPGTATVTIIGIGNWSESVSATYTIQAQSLPVDKISLAETEFTYDGTPKTPAVNGLDGLTEGVDYILNYKNNLAAGTATVTVVGIGAYSGTIERTFTIGQASLAGKTATVNPATVTYNGEAQKPAVTIPGLKEGVDFTVAYANNVNAGTATATVTGIGNYAGSTSATFTVAPATLKGTVTVSPTSVAYDGTPKTVSVTVKDGGKTLVSGTDYTVSFSNNTEPGRATVTVTGKGNYTGTLSGNFTITQGTLTGKTATVAGGSYVYDGNEKKPAVTIDGLTEGVDFTVAYANNVNAGTATVTITGIGKYTGTIVKTFTIGKKSVKAPTAKDAQGLVYDGTEQSGLGNLGDASDYTLTGVTTATEIGSYTATATLKDAVNTQWADGTSAARTILWQIKAATIDEDGVMTVKNQDQFIMGLPRFINEGTVTIRVDGFTPELPDGYLWKTLGDGLYAVSRISGATTSFVLDTRTTRTLGAAEAEQAFAHSATAWGEAADAGSATITFTRDGGDAETLGAYADGAADAAWTAEADGTYVFTHQPSGLTATFVVAGMGPQGSGTAADPYVVYNEEEFADAVARGKEAGQSPVYIRLGGEIALTEPLAVADANVSLDMNGFDITAGDDGAGNGKHAMVITGTGTVEFTGTGTVKGGDGATAGATAVEGSYTKAATVTIVDGVTGLGTEASPYIVRTRAEFEAVVKIGNDPVWVRLAADIPETVTIAETKKVICDLDGFDITGTNGTVEAPNGRPGIDVKGFGELVLTNSNATSVGKVTGGNGADGNPAGNGGAGVAITVGPVTVGANVVVQGGNGGLSTAGGADGQGAEGVTGTVFEPVEGEILPGKTGNGTEAHPYLVADNDDVAAAIAACAGETVYMRLVADFDDTLIVDNGTKGVNIDTFGHDVAGGKDEDGFGKPGVAVLGDGDIGFRNTGAEKSVIAGGEGTAGGAAVELAKDGATYAVDPEAEIDFVDGKGLGDGSAEYPIEVRTVEELEDAYNNWPAESGTLHVRLIADLGFAGTLPGEPENTDHGVQVRLDSRALNLSLDLNGHDIVGGRAADGRGEAAVVIGDGVNAGMSRFTVTDSSTGEKGAIFGGNGIAGQDGGNGIAFAYAIDANSPLALVTDGASVIGGNGGDNANGDAGKGAEGVNGKAATSEGGVVAKGQDGKAGQGTKAHPFEIWSQADVDAAYAGADPARDFVYMKLMTNLVGTITLDGGRNTMFYLEGHVIAGADGAAGDAETDGQGGQPALVVSAGDADISIFGEGALAGGNGGDDFYGAGGAAGKPGAGAPAYVMNGEGSLAIGVDVSCTDGTDGRTGDGTAEHPYMAGTAQEVEDAIASGEEPVYIRLTADIDETILIDESKKVIVDLNGYDITGTERTDGQGLPAVLVTGDCDLTFENTSDEKSYVTGGDGKTGGEAVKGVTPKVAEGDEELVEFRKGLAGSGTEEAPFEAASNEEIADALAKAAEKGLAEPVYIRLTADFDEPVSVDVTKSVVLDTNGHSVDGGQDAEGKGRPGLVTTGEGGTLTLENTSVQPSVVKGGDGQPGAPATPAGRPTVAAGEISFVDGLTGAGTEAKPYVVRDQAELEKALEAATEDPVWIELAADFTNMVVTTDKELVIDLKGHDIVGGVSDGNGEAALTVNGDKPVTVVDSAEEKGKVVGGSGASGEPAGHGASGIVAGGDVTVGEGVTVVGGNGGNSVTGAAGSGAPAVATAGTTAGDGTLVDGRDGTRGDGSEGAPYVVSTAEELEALCNDPDVTAEPLHIRLDNTIDSGIELPGDRNIVLDLDGHNICGRSAGDDGYEGKDGEPAVTVGAGAGTLQIIDTNDGEKGSLVGGNGANSPDPETEPGKGAEALAGKACEVQEGIAQTAGRDGRSGEGTAEHPFYVGTAEELEDVVNSFIPPLVDGEPVMDVYVVVTNDLTRGVTLDGDMSPKIDLNGHSITGGADEYGNGVPAITFGAGDGEPEITGPGALVGGDAALPGGHGATWVEVHGQNSPEIAENVELVAGLNGTGNQASPYEVGSAEEFERALEKGDSPVYIKLVANVTETLEIGVDKDVVLDFNGYSVTGGVGDDGNGLPGIAVTGTGDLTLTGDGYVKGGKGADELDGKLAGDGGEGVRMGEGAGALTIADANAFAIGGNGGNAETYGNAPGKGGAGVLPAGTGVVGHPENVKAGEDGRDSVELLNEIFGEGNIEIDVTTGGVRRIVLTRDLTGPIQIPDSIGQLEIDMAGYDITGAAGGPAEDGSNGIEIIRTGNGNAEITLVGPGSVHGGNGGDSDMDVGGKGGIGLMTETGAIAVVNVGEGVDIQGGRGGNGRNRGGQGGTGATGAIGVNEGSIIGGTGGSGMSVSEGKAGDGGAGGDSLSGTIEEDLGYVKGGKGGDGGNSGGNVGDEPGCGGRGGDQESDETRGESGSTGMTGEGIKTTLEHAFGGREIVDVTKNEDGVYVVTITNEIPSEVGTVVIPDAVGDLIIDLKGHDILGPDGTSANPDGSPALLIESTGKCIAGSIVQIINSLAPQGGTVKGGDGYDASETAKARGGDGAPAIMEEDDYPVAFKIGEGVVARGGNGGDSKVAGGEGGAGIDGNVKVNEGEIYGGNGGSVKGGGVPGEGAKAVTNEQPNPEGVLVDGRNGKPTLTIVAVHGRFPWNGCIDIDYTIDGDVTDCDFQVSFRTHGIVGQFVTLDARTFLTEPDLTPGTHRVTWNAAADFILDHDYRGKVTVTASLVPDGFRGTLPIGLTDSAALSLDFRKGTMADPIVIAKSDDLSAITYSASDWVLDGAESTTTVVACDKNGAALETLWTGSTGEDAFTWVPTELTTGLVKLTHTVGGETEEAWFQILPSAVGDRGYRLPVDFTKGDGEENQKFVPIGWDWLADQIPGFDRTKERRETITEKLREIAANGLELWQNAILGWSGTRDPNYNDISVDKKNNRALIVGLDLAKIASSLDGVNVCYVLKRLVDGEWVEVPGKVSDTPSFEIDLGHEDPTGYYRIYLRFEPTDKSFDEDVGEDGTEN